jgi:putative tryptophan/tyrosine transport system substrate-binding protein
MIVVPTLSPPEKAQLLWPLPPAIACRQYMVETFSLPPGGLITYAADADEITRNVARYADRILKGAKPADLPVQAPIRLRLVINVKAAKALGLTIPETLLATADEVIQ